MGRGEVRQRRQPVRWFSSQLALWAPGLIPTRMRTVSILTRQRAREQGMQTSTDVRHWLSGRGLLPEGHSLALPV